MKREEREERGGKIERKKKKINWKRKRSSGMLYDFKTHMSEFVNATQRACKRTEIQLQLRGEEEKKEEHKCNEKPNKN